MSTGSRPGVVELSPADSWAALEETADAALVDVRTRAEWAFVGVPDLSGLDRRLILAEWRRFPDMSRNEDFVEELLDGFGGDLPSRLLFICRSGARSMEAAQAVAASLAGQGRAAECINVAEGFEGDLDERRHRGMANGWKARGLPWRQS